MEVPVHGDAVEIDQDVVVRDVLEQGGEVRELGGYERQVLFGKAGGFGQRFELCSQVDRAAKEQLVGRLRKTSQ